MRDLGDMIQRVRKKIGDYADTMVADPHIETAMQVAADQLWDHLMEDAEGKETLRVYSEPVYLFAEVEEYELPENCLWLRSVEYRSRPAERSWTALTRKAAPEGPLVRNGTNELFAVDGGAGGPSLFWCDDAPQGYIRIWPALKSVNGEQIRFVYYRKPTFPQHYGATFNNPDEYGEAEMHLPDRITEAIEWGAALELATDKIGAGIDYEFAQKTYYQTIRSIVRGAHTTKPVRRYIPRVRG